MPLPSVVIEYPGWVEAFVDWDATYATDEDKMRLAISLSRENVVRKSGGPFGAAIFEAESGKLVAVGMNLVVPRNNSVLHAEMVAFMMGQQRLGSYTLAAPDLPVHELVTSCDPCAMCLAATLWSGVKRVVSGASHKDAKSIDFDEGPVFQRSHEYLEERGIEHVRKVLREEATEVLKLYYSGGGPIYNA